jgi:integrase
MVQTKRALGRFHSTALAFAALERFRERLLDGQIKPVRELADRPTFTNPVVNEPRAKNVPRDLNWLCKVYLEHNRVMKEKQPSTQTMEASGLARVCRAIGTTPVVKLTPRIIQSYMTERMKGSDRKGCTINGELAYLRCVVRFAINRSFIESDFTTGVEKIKYRKKVFGLVTHDHVERYVQAVQAATAQKAFSEGASTRLINFVWFLAFTGARWREAAAMRWEDIDWVNENVNFGTTGVSKNGKARVVDFNPKLKEHLLKMQADRAALPQWRQSKWLFPKVHDPLERCSSFGVEDFKLRKTTGFSLGGFHNLRRYYAASSVMGGIDYMTIARWLGHQDGGALVGKVYGNISSPHAKRMAQNIRFGGD